METAVCGSGFLLLVFITGAQLSPGPQPVFGAVGGSTEFFSFYTTRSQYSRIYIVLYRVTTDGDLLLANCSRGPQLYGPKPDGYKVHCELDFIAITSLTMSQSGDYRTEHWKGEKITKHTRFRLTVCAEGNKLQQAQVYDDDGAVVCRMNSTVGNGSSLQVYRYNWDNERFTLVLDTNSSLEPLEEDLRSRLQVDLNTSVVSLSGVTELDEIFYCAVWRGAQCQSYSDEKVFVYDKPVFTHVGESITLPCISKGTFSLGHALGVLWITPSGAPMVNMTDQQEVMHHNQTRNCSLFIPSVSQQHSGMYTYWKLWEDHTSRKRPKFYLYVCTSVSPLYVMFSHGESVHLNYTAHLDFSSVDGIMWYRQRVLEPLELILDSRRGSVSLPQDLRGRVSLRGQVTWRGRETKWGKLTEGERLTNSPLILSKLTAEDSGLYTWRVYKLVLETNKHVCFEGSFRLVYRDPFGVDSPFYRVYASLMGCGLLGLVTAVIWFKQRSRRGEQTSGRQSREGQQSGDEDLHEEVEMAELSG